MASIRATGHMNIKTRIWYSMVYSMVYHSRVWYCMVNYHKDSTKQEFWCPLYIGPWNQNVRSLCLCTLLGPSPTPPGIPSSQYLRSPVPTCHKFGNQEAVDWGTRGHWNGSRRMLRSSNSVRRPSVTTSSTRRLQRISVRTRLSSGIRSYFVWFLGSEYLTITPNKFMPS